MSALTSEMRDMIIMNLTEKILQYTLKSLTDGELSEIRHAYESSIKSKDQKKLLDTMYKRFIPKMHMSIRTMRKLYHENHLIHKMKIHELVNETLLYINIPEIGGLPLLLDVVYGNIPKCDLPGILNSNGDEYNSNSNYNRDFIVLSKNDLTPSNKNSKSSGSKSRRSRFSIFRGGARKSRKHVRKTKKR